MKKKELIDYLVEEYDEDRKELKKMTKDELQEMLENYTDTSDLFPNGRDYDAEDWD